MNFKNEIIRYLPENELILIDQIHRPLFFHNRKKKSPEEKIRRKIKKKIRNQSRFLKHSIIYVVFVFFFVVLIFVTRNSEFVFGFSIVFIIWMIGLTFHGLSAFVFNRIDSWEEIKYRKKLKELRMEDDENGRLLEAEEKDWKEDVMDLKSYERLRKELDDKWGEGDFV